MNTAFRKAFLLSAAVTCFVVSGVSDASSQPKVQVRGLIDLVAHDEEGLLYLNMVNTRDTNFDPLRARLFLEGGNESTQFFLQTLFSPESVASFRLYGAYLLHRLFSQQQIFLEAGLIPVHDGVWASQTYSDKNPLIAIPLAYYWKSSMHAWQMPVDLDQLLSQRGRGQFGPVYQDSTGIRGRAYHSMPILYDNCWNYGAYSIGTFWRLEYALGLTVGSPGDPVASTDTNDDLAVHAKIGYAVTPGLRMYASWAQGAYLADAVTPYVPAGKTINDYNQTVWVGSAQYQWRHFFVLTEFFYNHYETPLRDEGLAQTSFYVQGVYTFRPGWYVAARYDELRHEKVQDSSGSTVTWDDNVHRIEAGLGYHVSRELLAKFVLQNTDTGNGWTSDTLLPAIQLSYSF